MPCFLRNGLVSLDVEFGDLRLAVGVLHYECVEHEIGIVVQVQSQLGHTSAIQAK
jgi:hypothetical protein